MSTRNLISVGVDNGRFWFDHVRVPRENLLNRFGNVTKDGKYESPIKDPDMRFAVMMGINKYTN